MSGQSDSKVVQVYGLVDGLIAGPVDRLLLKSSKRAKDSVTSVEMPLGQLIDELPKAARTDHSDLRLRERRAYYLYAFRTQILQVLVGTAAVAKLVSLTLEANAGFSLTLAVAGSTDFLTKVWINPLVATLVVKKRMTDEKLGLLVQMYLVAMLVLSVLTFGQNPFAVASALAAVLLLVIALFPRVPETLK